MTDIDFTKYTDAQLEVAARFTVAAQDELDRRRTAGQDDGSRERVQEFMRSNRKRNVRER